jgi:hypothetical protein
MTQESDRHETGWCEEHQETWPLGPGYCQGCQAAIEARKAAEGAELQRLRCLYDVARTFTFEGPGGKFVACASYDVDGNVEHWSVAPFDMGRALRRYSKKLAITEACRLAQGSAEDVTEPLGLAFSRIHREAAVATAIDHLLECAYEAASVDCHIADKARLFAAIIKYERAAGVPCRGCGKPDCARERNDEGELLCDPNTIPEEA